MVGSHAIAISPHTLGCFLAYSRLTHEYGKSERRTMQKYGKDKRNTKHVTFSSFPYYSNRDRQRNKNGIKTL